ncbi:MAG TPA: amidohydrolase family protein [Pseudolabrys sp.]|jgi:aminocarboxymuconate-semialdehyde decarboxylase
MAIWNKYANTAARTHGKPGRETRPKSLTVDMHAHVAVPGVTEIVAPHLKESTDPLVQTSTPETQALMAKQAADITTRISTTDERFGVMDEMGVDMQLICPAPPQIYYNVPVDVGVKAACALNDGIAEYVGKRGDRLVALGGVPMQDGNEAAKELERGMKQLGFKGVEILTNVNGKELSDPTFAPFWKKAEELDALVLIHPTGFTQPQRFGRFYFNNVIGNPLDTTMALHYLIFDGVFERHPKLRVLAVHGGGYLGAYSGRIDHAWGARSDAHGDLPKPPTTYLRKNVYLDTVVFTPHQLEALVKTFGADRIVLGTDYPYDMLEFDPIGHINSVESFDAGTRAAVAGGNAKRLLGM